MGWSSQLDNISSATWTRPASVVVAVVGSGRMQTGHGRSTRPAALGVILFGVVPPALTRLPIRGVARQRVPAPEAL